MRYLALAWGGGDAAGAARRMRAALGVHEAWAMAAAGDQWCVWTAPAATPWAQALPGGGGVLVGEFFPNPPEGAGRAQRLLRELPPDPLDAARRLAREGWGRYVAVLAEAGRTPAVFRDPSGAVEALMWTRDGVAVAASGLCDLPRELLPTPLRLNWSTLARIMAEPAIASCELALDGLACVLPGTLRRADGGTATVWSPVDFLAADAPQGREAEALLRERVESCVAALASRRGTLLAELSGGFDSSVVAAVLAGAGLGGRVAEWVNYFDPARREGDERPWARAVAARHGLRLAEVPLEASPVREEDFADLVCGPRPPFTALGREHDGDMAARARRTGAEAIVSGQGGDAVFFQMPTPLVAADEVRRRGLRGLAGPLLGDVARWTRRSAWTVLFAALGRGAGPGPSRAPLPGTVPRGAEVRHPWAEAAAGAPPAKRLQVAALASAQVYLGDNRRRRAAEILHPLLAQPVVELCLALPAAALTGGVRDRDLARRAFAPILPACVAERRSKGSLGAFYGRTVAASLDWLRPHLLESALCEAGLLDRAALEAALAPEQLIWRGGASAILSAAVTECWVRYWQGRVPDSEAAPRPRGRGGGW